MGVGAIGAVLVVILIGGKGVNFDRINVDTSGRASNTWGQPWLSRYLRWKRAARAAR